MDTNRPPTHSPANAFELLRVAAALWVLYSHAFALYGLHEPVVFEGHASVAVDVFFSISGYLVVQSWVRDADIWRFLLRRSLRIFPGLVVAVLVSIFLIGALATELKLPEYFSSRQIWAYLISNIGLTVAEGELPGVFKSNPFPSAVNGSLWTLRYEVLMYALLALLGGICNLLRRPRLMRVGCMLLLLCFLLIGVVCTLQGINRLSAPIPFIWRAGFDFDIVRIASLGIYFFSGCCLYLYRDQIRLSFWPVAPALLAAVFFPPNVWQHLLIWILVPYTVIVAAWNSPLLFKKFRGFDYSYGIYIYAFPIQQLVSMHGMQWQWSFSLTLLVSVALTIFMAALSWHWIERPALTMKPQVGAGSPEIKQKAIEIQ